MKYIVSVLMLCLGVSLANGQEVYTSSGRSIHAKKEKKVKGFDPSRLILGGGLVAGFGTGYVDAGISPIAGYAITDHFSAGIGIGYEYLYEKYSDYSLESTYKSNIIYPSVWARYIVFRNIFVESSFEYDLVTQSQSYFDGTSTTNQNASANVPCLLVGAGIRQPIGGRVSVVAELLYDVLQQQQYFNPYYGQPVLRIGICTGF